MDEGTCKGTCDVKACNAVCNDRKGGMCKDCAWYGKNKGFIPDDIPKPACYFGGQFVKFTPRKVTCERWVDKDVLRMTDVSRQDFMKVMYKGAKPC